MGWELLMRSKITKSAIVCVVMLSVGGSTCEAGPILDWLFPNRASRREASNVGQLTYRIPLNGYQYNMSGYSPTTSYRSVWAPIPVTSYRPVSYVNPLSTGTQTNMLPCNTQQWQARRVPYTSYRPSSLFGGGSGWQTVGQSAPVSSYPAVTANYGGAQVSYQQTTPWAPTTPSGVTANYRSASPIDDGWTVVGSGVSYAAPADGGTGLLSYGAAPAAVRRAGYLDGQSFSPSGVTPLPSSLEQSTWRPVTNAPDGNVCQNCQSDYEPALLESEKTSPAEDPLNRWVPIDPEIRSEDSSRTKVSPADESPSLPARTERRRIDSGLGNDPYRWEAAQDPDESDPEGKLKQVRPQLERNTDYRPPRAFDAQSPQVRPAITRGNGPYNRREGSRAVYQAEEAAQSTPTQAVPYLKPIPDLNRDSQRPTKPSLLLDGANERTARNARFDPDRQAIPIDWNQVDINRQGGLTRVKSPVSTVNTKVQPPVIDLTPPQVDDEGGWRRVR